MSYLELFTNLALMRGVSSPTIFPGVSVCTRTVYIVKIHAGRLLRYSTIWFPRKESLSLSLFLSLFLFLSFSLSLSLSLWDSLSLPLSLLFFYSSLFLSPSHALTHIYKHRKHTTRTRMHTSLCVYVYVSYTTQVI